MSLFRHIGFRSPRAILNILAFGLQLVLPIESQSQGTVVRGVVMDTTTREPIPFANIQIIGT
ncbi:MAG: hypothetical protein HY562_01000, partial [Ignavibacteriales bacterium]|nr:hypothetical protein [Ignavibacteriales bacterium]